MVTTCNKLAVCALCANLGISYKRGRRWSQKSTGKHFCAILNKVILMRRNQVHQKYGSFAWTLPLGTSVCKLYIRNWRLHLFVTASYIRIRVTAGSFFSCYPNHSTQKDIYNEEYHLRGKIEWNKRDENCTVYWSVYKLICLLGMLQLRIWCWCSHLFVISFCHIFSINVGVCGL